LTPAKLFACLPQTGRPEIEREVARKVVGKLADFFGIDEAAWPSARRIDGGARVVAALGYRSTSSVARMQRRVERDLKIPETMAVKAVWPILDRIQTDRLMKYPG